MLRAHNGRSDRSGSTPPAKSDHSTTDARNPTEDIERLDGKKEIHDDMVRVHQEHAEHDLYESEDGGYDVENDLQWGIGE